MVCEEISASSLSYKHVHAQKSAVYRERCKLRPTIPKSIEDVFSAAESPAFGLESFDVIIRDETNKILIIKSENNLLQSEACNADGYIRGRIRKSHDNTFVHFDTPRRSVGTG
ncbi:hypothetical protein ElyMa_003016100 [Elysia marginata]|uniref:SHSP domain-containing protein n=1 Tax=Elysia marginata TaxID=1093978 RepID=A0AAV4IHG3_9GAST|nr:hypothetical protein ElyMa_003016100 [Elysia marginata]